MSFRERILALLITFSGIGFVFLGIITINRAVEKSESGKTISTVQFVVPRTMEKRERKSEPYRQRKPPKSKPPALAPFPEFEGSLSGIQVEIPDYTSDSFNLVSDDLIGSISEDIIMTEDTVDTLPEIVSSPIIYPERAKQRNIEGKVVVNIQIGADGSVKKVKIVEAQPPGVFEETVLKAVPSWRFTPAVYNGRRVEMWATLSIPFKTR